jgi:hypothetical protein
MGVIITGQGNSAKNCPITRSIMVSFGKIGDRKNPLTNRRYPWGELTLLTGKEES